MSRRSGIPYTDCKLFYDGSQPIAVGHFLRTPAGSAYRIESIRQNRNRPYRRHLGCLRWPLDEIPEGAVVHPLYWYPRTKRRARSLQSLSGASKPPTDEQILRNDRRAAFARSFERRLS